MSWMTPTEAIATLESEEGFYGEGPELIEFVNLEKNISGIVLVSPDGDEISGEINAVNNASGICYLLDFVARWQPDSYSLNEKDGIIAFRFSW